MIRNYFFLYRPYTNEVTIMNIGEKIVCRNIHILLYKKWASVRNHYSDVIMGVMASQITSLPIVYLTIYSGADQRKHQSSASLAFVRGIHRWPVNSPHKWPVTRKTFPFNDVIMTKLNEEYETINCCYVDYKKHNKTIMCIYFKGYVFHVRNHPDIQEYDNAWLKIRIYSTQLHKRVCFAYLNTSIQQTRY